MKLRSLVLALLIAAGASVAAHAQGALYITPIAVRVSNSTVDNSTYSFLGPNTKSRMFYGVQFGGFYDLPHEYQPKSIEIGLDVRDAVLHGNNALLNSFLVGPRLAFSPFAHPFHPYVEPFVGDGSTRAPETSIKINKVQYGVFAGVDYDFSKHVSWRVVEVGYSSLATASATTIGITASIPSATLLNFSSGLTFHLP
jgi:opacity protein-like surface antigen